MEEGDNYKMEVSAQVLSSSSAGPWLNDHYVTLYREIEDHEGRPYWSEVDLSPGEQRDRLVDHILRISYGTMGEERD